jgi:hypothetical protein
MASGDRHSCMVPSMGWCVGVLAVTMVRRQREAMGTGTCMLAMVHPARIVFVTSAVRKVL